MLPSHGYGGNHERDEGGGRGGVEGDGPLLINAVLVVAERYSALKKARFGSETSSEALSGMSVLVCLGAGMERGLEERLVGIVKAGVPEVALAPASKNLWGAGE